MVGREGFEPSTIGLKVHKGNLSAFVFNNLPWFPLHYEHRIFRPKTPGSNTTQTPYSLIFNESEKGILVIFPPNPCNQYLLIQGIVQVTHCFNGGS